MGTHDGHRERLRRLYLDGDYDALSEVQKLELLLTFSIARRDVNPIAHALLDRFGNLSGVLSAQPGELMQVKGVGEATAVLLTAIPKAARHGKTQRINQKLPLDTTGKIGEFLIPYFDANTEESAYLVFLNAKCCLLRCVKLSDGELNTVNISVRRIVELALQHKAVMVVLAHNHVSGICRPSEEDLATTKAVAEALRTVGVSLVDHVIVVGDGYYSMREHGDMT